MESLLRTATNLLPYHLLSYGTLLGTELFQVSLSLWYHQEYSHLIHPHLHPHPWQGTNIKNQSFVNTKLCYKYLLPREFLALQKRIFPVYFGCQVGLAVLTAATRPPYGVFTFIKDIWEAVPLVIVLVTGSLNWFVFGPRTISAGLVRLTLKGEFLVLWTGIDQMFHYKSDC